MPKQTIRVSAALIFDDQNKIIITRRPEGSHLGGMWEFPGGKIESGESAEQALVRELAEELALDIKVGTLYFQNVFEYNEKFVDISFFMCTQTDPAQEPQAVETAEWRRVRLIELEQFEFPPADKEVVRQLLEFFTAFHITEIEIFSNIFDFFADLAEYLFTAAKCVVENSYTRQTPFINIRINCARRNQVKYGDALTLLPPPVDTSDPLFNFHWIPGKIIIDYAIAELIIQTFTTYLGKQHDIYCIFVFPV